MSRPPSRLGRVSSALDRGLLHLVPGWAAARAHNRARALAYRQAYEATAVIHRAAEGRPVE